MEMYYEKRVISNFFIFMNIIECTYTSKLYGIVYIVKHTL